MYSYVSKESIKKRITNIFFLFTEKYKDRLQKKIESTPSDCVTGEKKGVEAKDGNKYMHKKTKELLIFKNLKREKYKINPEKSQIEILINI